MLRSLRCGFVLLATGMLLFIACDSSFTSPDVASSGQEATILEAKRGHSPANVNAQLAAVRRGTAPFHDVSAAIEAGYGKITECVAHPTSGAQGIHYGKSSLITNAGVVAAQPEVLMYEPRKNGRLRLVGVEYIIPFDILSSDSDPPTLFGQHFHANEELDLWALHVWLWRHNPRGMFADWNPKVTCAFAEE